MPPRVRELEIKTATIEIKVLRVDGHKMTKATFRQIPIVQLSDSQALPSEDQMLGWVVDAEKIYLLISDGGPKRYELHNVMMEATSKKIVSAPYTSTFNREEAEEQLKVCEASTGNWWRERAAYWTDIIAHLDAYDQFWGEYAEGRYEYVGKYVKSNYDQLYIAT